MGAAAVALFATLAACGSGPKETAVATASSSASAKPAPTTPPPPSEVHEQITAHVCPARAKVAALLSHAPPDAAPAPTPEKTEPASWQPPATSAGSADRGGSDAYRTVAPGVVLIRAGDGMRGGYGTGVVVDKEGYILTNNHVIDGGRKKDFVISVTVNFGDLTPTGRMTRQEKTYEAVVVKADPVRDLALVKVKDPPATLTVVPLAKSAPQIGEKVMAIGNAGIGFLWAAKSCSVASVGERQQDSSRIAGFECPPPDPALTGEELEVYKKECDERKKELKELFSLATQGLAVQTDCAITHGDSGGPLVNVAGELVGLNQSLMVDAATASFHVHVDEIRDFIASHPTEGVPILPDPLCDAGTNTTLEDVDLDGVPETLITQDSRWGYLSRFGRMSLLIDIEQTHLSQRADDSPWTPKDTPIAFLSNPDGIFVWYDLDYDGRWDILLYDKDSDGAPDVAYRIQESGALVEDKSALPHHDFSHRYLKSKSLEPRIAKIAMAAGGPEWVSDITLSKGVNDKTFPDAILGGGSKGILVDSDYDGTPDAVRTQGMFSRGLLVALEGIGDKKSGDSVDDLLAQKKLQPRASFITRGKKIYARYDVDGDGKFSLVLVGDLGGGDAIYTTEAYRLTDGGDPTPVPEHIGRNLLRPDLLNMTIQSAPGFYQLGFDVASDGGLGSLPAVAASYGKVSHRAVKGLPFGTLVDVTRYWTSTTLIDAGNTTPLPKKPTDKDVVDAVNGKKFRSVVAIVHQKRGYSGLDWVFYNTNEMGAYDLVLISDDGLRTVSQAFKVDSDGKLTVDEDAKKGRPLRYSVFKDKKLSTKVKDALTKGFDSASVEP
ncbi:MAG: trypsin-like peptidase domain-containing protein [Polyangiaceae bacterium]